MRGMAFYALAVLVVVIAVVKLIARRANRRETLAFCLLALSCVIMGLNTRAYYLDFIAIGLLVVSVLLIAFNQGRRSEAR